MKKKKFDNTESESSVCRASVLGTVKDPVKYINSIRDCNDANSCMNSLIDEIRSLPIRMDGIDSDGKSLVVLNTNVLADQIESIWEEAQISINEDNARFLIKEYANTPDDQLTESANELKKSIIRAASPITVRFCRSLLEIADDIKRWAKDDIECCGRDVLKRSAEAFASQLIMLARKEELDNTK